MKSKLLIVGLILLRSASAQTMDPATRRIIDELLTRIDTLEKRVAELEGKKTAVVAPSAATPASAAQTHDHEAPRASEAAQAMSYPSLKISGFSDVNFAATTLHGASGGFGAQTLLGAHTGFQEGQFTLHFSSALSPKVSVFSELSMTARADAGTGSPPVGGFNPEIERVIIRYDLNDRFKLSFGRYHTPVNYWNNAYHHGAWLQTTISRPEMVQFGSTFLPVHFVGALAEGTLPAKGLNLNYNLGVGNGRSSVLSRGGDFGDVNNNRAWLAGIFLKPDSLYGFQIGGSIYRDHISPASGVATREWIESAHVVWQRGPVEALAEISNVSHKPILSKITSNSQGFYFQPAYRLPVDKGRWKPYYRFERMHIPLSDALFRTVPSYHSSTAGTRFDISSFAAFKLEYRHYVRRNLPSVKGAFMQTSFTF